MDLATRGLENNLKSIALKLLIFLNYSGVLFVWNF